MLIMFIGIRSFGIPACLVLTRIGKLLHMAGRYLTFVIWNLSFQSLLDWQNLFKIKNYILHR